MIGAWSKDSIKIVKDTYSKPSMSVTRYATCNKGKFYDETVCRKDDSAITAPRKGEGPLSDVTKYGGYTSQKTAYFAIVTSVDKKREKNKDYRSHSGISYLQAKDRYECDTKIFGIIFKRAGYSYSES